MISQQQLIACYKRACELDIKAFKPGNVSIYNAGHDMTVDDFIISSEVSSEAITNPLYSLGEKIFYAVKETRTAVGCNTNLGIILLCAPLIQAASEQNDQQSLRDCLQQVLDNTTKQDADWVFKAITLASPGGLGDSEQQDVKLAAEVTLTEAMSFAADRDRVALQYVSNYTDIFTFAILCYNKSLIRFGDQAWALVSVYARLLATFSDSHIERKYGDKHSGWVLEQMITVDDALQNTQDPEQLLPMLHDVDRMFKEKGINPGTTADLTVATVLVVLMEALSVR